MHPQLMLSYLRVVESRLDVDEEEPPPPQPASNSHLLNDVHRRVVVGSEIIEPPSTISEISKYLLLSAFCY